MNVNNFEKYICLYLDGDLNPSETEEFEALLENDSECEQKFNDYKKMLDELSNLGTLKTSDDFLYKLHGRINKPEIIPPKMIFGYDYMTISGIAVSVGVFMFAISTFMTSESIPSFNLNKLSSKSVESKTEVKQSNTYEIAEEDTLVENEEVEIPKIHLVGGKK